MSVADLAIPVVDLQDLSSPHPDDQARAAEALSVGFGQFGLIFIRNHDIPFDTLEDFYHAFLGFTSRSDDDKQSLSRGDLWYQRGWTPPNTERAVVAGGQPDFKECYFITPTQAEPGIRAQYPQIFADNIWPSDSDAFRKHYLELSHRLQDVGRRLLRGCALALELAPHTFESIIHQGPHVTRALRYLPLNAEQVNTDILWGEEHTDFNLLTLLPGGRFLSPEGSMCPRPDDVCGLYLRTRPSDEFPHGQMVQGRAPKGCIVAQVGQQLEILTGGTFLATPHVIKAPAQPAYSRVAMAHFVHAHPHQQLFPLSPFQSAEALKSYSPPRLAGTYALKTLVDIGLAPDNTLNQLCLLYTSPSPRDRTRSRMPSSA